MALKEEINRLDRSIQKLTKALEGGRGSQAPARGLGQVPISELRQGRAPLRAFAPRALRPVTRGATATQDPSLLRRAAGRVSGGIKGLTGLGPGALAIGIGGALGAAVVGGGAINVQRGGTFAGGAASSGVDLLARVPVLGELTGAAPVQRIQRGAQGDLNALTNRVARFGGAEAITPGVRKFLADQMVVQNRNIEADRQRNTRLITDKVGQAASGQGPIEDFVKSIQSATAALKAIGSVVDVFS